MKFQPRAVARKGGALFANLEATIDEGQLVMKVPLSPWVRRAAAVLQFAKSGAAVLVLDIDPIKSKRS